MTDTEKLIKKLKRQKKIYHNKIVDIYFYKHREFHFKSDLIDFLKNEQNLHNSVK